MSGCLRIQTPNGTTHDCRDEPFAIPGDIDAISRMRIELTSPGSTRLVIVEKETIFHRLKEARFSCVEDGGVPCILVTGRGYPSVSTRAFISRLVAEDDRLGRAAAITDFNPHGVHIMLTYKHGGGHQAIEAERVFRLPRITWCGVHSRHLCAQNDNVAKLTDRDTTMVRNLLAGHGVEIDASMRSELELMINRGVKADIEALVNTTSSNGVDSTANFVAMMKEMLQNL